jgi:bacterioferritin-associated ferredoxin
MTGPNKKSKSERLICLCNEVSQETIEKAIANGCRTLSRIFDATRAGVGACGGSCQSTLKKMLETYLQTGQFPENPRPPSNRRKSPK